MPKVKGLFQFWPIILIFGFNFLLRVVRLEELTYFTYDESIPAFIGSNLLQLHKLPLIGGVTPFGVHLPPYFYWLLSLVLIIGRLNPVVWGIAGAFFSTFTILAIYKVGQEFFNKKVGFIAATTWAFSYLANIYDRHFWALYWGPIITTTTLYSLKKILEGNRKYVFLLSFVIILSITTDPSNIIVIFLTIVVYVIYKIRLKKQEIIAIILILLSLMPLVLFDMRHNFANIKPFFSYLNSQKTESRFRDQNFIDRSNIFANSFSRLIYTFGDNEISKQYSYCSSFIEEKYNNVPIIFNILSYLLLLGFVYLCWKSKIKERKLLVLLMGLYFAGIQIYGILFNGDIFEHYITGLFPIFIIIFAIFLSFLPNKLMLVILSLFLFTNLYKFSLLRNSQGLTYKREAVEYTIDALQGKDFSLESLSTCWRYSGYRYLFLAFGKEPVKSYVDPNLGHLYPRSPIWQSHPNTVVAIVTHDFIPETDDFYRKYSIYKAHEINNKLFGNIEVIIMSNHSKWFDKFQEENSLRKLYTF